MTTSIILSTGIFDLLKDHIRRRKLTKYNQEKLERELRNARQVLNKDIPPKIVTVNTIVRVKELESGIDYKDVLGLPSRAWNNNNTMSIRSPIGVAIVGYGEGVELE